MNLSISNGIEWVVMHKWWIAALIPFGLAVMALRSRG